MPAMSASGPTRAGPDDLAARWHGLAIHLLRAVRREDAKAGLSGPRLSALSVIVFGGPVTLSELAAAEQVRPPTMSRMVDALEADGLVRRVADREDRRRVRLVATPNGARLLKAGRKRRVARIAAPIGALAADDRRILDQAASIMAGVIGELASAPVNHR
jgi:DNA-binding MarR family transcriptional regulator